MSVAPQNGVSSPKLPNSETKTTVIVDEKLENRDKWGSKLDFILSCLGYAVGLGNVWRFPYLCGRSGGASFLIPYLIMLIFAGLPTFYLELAIGQYAALTPHILYRRMCPIFTGIGYTMIAISFFTGFYYNMIIAWSMFYFAVSFTSQLPFENCKNSWNTELCYDDTTVQNCTNTTTGTLYYKGICQNATQFNQSMKEYIWNLQTNPDRASPASEYLDRRVLGISEGLHDIGTPRWELVVCLLAAWILVFFCLIKGIKSSGKVVYFTATFPYVILLILLVRGVTLEGAMEGIKFYMVPNFTKLQEGQVWGDAAIQIFFSLSLGGGGLTTLASYNEFNNNILRDTLIVVFGNCATSIFAGFVIFPILGYLALKIGKPVAEIAASGPSLAFVAYPGALVRLPGAPFWAVMFFFMLILLGIDSQLVIVEVVITCIIDQWPSLRPWKRKMGVVATVCLVSFLLGLVLCCPGGPYILNLIDTFAGGWPLVVACLVEVCMVSWAYGIRRFIKDIRLMLGVPENKFWKIIGYPVNPYWWANWLILTPVLLTFVLIFNFATYARTTYGNYTYPSWGEIIGWLVALSCVMWIPLIAIVMTIYAIVTNKGIAWLIRPSQDWGPSDLTARDTLNQQYGMTQADYGNPTFAQTTYSSGQPYPPRSTGAPYMMDEKNGTSPQPPNYDSLSKVYP